MSLPFKAHLCFCLYRKHLTKAIPSKHCQQNYFYTVSLNTVLLPIIMPAPASGPLDIFHRQNDALVDNNRVQPLNHPTYSIRKGLFMDKLDINMSFILDTGRHPIIPCLNYPACFDLRCMVNTFDALSTKRQRVNNRVYSYPSVYIM